MLKSKYMSKISPDGIIHFIYLIHNDVLVHLSRRYFICDSSYTTLNALRVASCIFNFYSAIINSCNDLIAGLKNKSQHKDHFCETLFFFFANLDEWL